MLRRRREYATGSQHCPRASWFSLISGGADCTNQSASFSNSNAGVAAWHQDEQDSSKSQDSGTISRARRVVWVHSFNIS